MPPWVRRMTGAEVTAAKKLAADRTEQEIVRMAVACVNRGRLIGMWFGGSCLVPLMVLAAPAVRPSVITGNLWLWLVAMVAAMLLPMPAMVAARRCSREGNVIAYAYWTKKDPSRLSRD